MSGPGTSSGSAGVPMKENEVGVGKIIEGEKERLKNKDHHLAQAEKLNPLLDVSELHRTLLEINLEDQIRLLKESIGLFGKLEELLK